MKNKFLIVLFVTVSSLCFNTRAQEYSKVNIFNNVVFYDGYKEDIVDKDLNDGVLRFRNSLYSVKIDQQQIADMGDDLKMKVVIGALCDNYDRIGNVCLAFVPKGAESYEYEAVERIELTRLITPFMNKNKQPDEVPYEYEIANVGRILKDASLQSRYDFWIEFEVFGVPYAANTQVAGCKDREDVFDGTVDLLYTPSNKQESGNIVVPINVKLPEIYGNVNFNSYTENATDTIGVTTRTFEFEIPEDVADSRIYLIMTNHGAGTNGEEYVRRLHLVYYDEELALSYTPGGVSCEPYRIYNTQANGIYGYSRSEASWKSSSNWCPGQAVPIREIHLGAQKAGVHKVMIRVPKARFYGNDGDFKPSLYFHGVKDGVLEAGVDQVWFEGPEVKYTFSGGILNFDSDDTIKELLIHSFDGIELKSIKHPSSQIDLNDLTAGAYILTFITEDGRTTGVKIVK